MNGKTSLFLVILAFAANNQANAVQVFQRPGLGTGVVIQSATWDPDGSDYDIFAYDSFVLANQEAISEVRWRGGGVAPSTVNKFKITLYASIAAGTQPYCGLPSESETIYLYSGWSNGNANQTYAGTFGGTPMYDYSYPMSSPFLASPNVKYWLKVEAWTSSFPFWGIERGSGENGGHFRFVRGAHMFQNGVGDLAFSLFSDATPSSPNSFTVIEGLHFGGNLGSLAVDDDDKLFVLLDDFSPNSKIEFTTQARTANPATMKLLATTASSRTDLACFSEVFDLSTSNWLQVDFRLSSIVDSTFRKDLPAPLNRFIDVSGAVHTRSRSIPSADIDAADGWIFSIDLWNLES